MFLLREVLAWLRYCVSIDPVCLEGGIVAEEIADPDLVINIHNDGTRILALYRVQDGFTPRVEVRFTNLYPQVWFIPLEGEHQYVTSPASMNFPGDWRSWTRSDFVNYLLEYAKAKLCFDTAALAQLIEISAFDKAKINVPKPKIDLQSVLRLLTAVDASVKKGSTLDEGEALAFLKKQKSDITDFARGMVFYFLNGDKLPQQKIGMGGLTQISEDDFINVSDKKHLVEASFFRAQLDDPAFTKDYSPKFIAWLQANKKQKTAADVTFATTVLQRAVRYQNMERPIEDALFGLSHASLGEFVEAGLKNGEIPLPYLDVLQNIDPTENLLPWSYLRRNVVAYKYPRQVTSNVGGSVVDWLTETRLLQPLYQIDENSAGLIDGVKIRLDIYAQQTISNPLWIRYAMDQFADAMDEVSWRTCLQSEFDLWLTQALSPSVSQSALPFSPFAYSTGTKHEDLYDKMYGAWLNEVKNTIDNARPDSIDVLASSLDSFFKMIPQVWNIGALASYRPKAPAVDVITDTVKKKDMDGLFSLLVGDVEKEVGMTMPENVKKGLVASPYFNLIYSEMRFQSIRV